MASMLKQRHVLWLVGVATLTLLPVTQALACSSCGCTLSSDWVGQGLNIERGLSLDIRYDYVDQVGLRAGGDSVNPPALPNGNELEKRSTNRYTTTTVAYNFNKDWGISVLIPYLDRSHSTIAPGDTSASFSHTGSLSDMKVIGRYRGFSESADSGLLFGFKLPTGARDFNFNAGPQVGQRLDRSLQPGSGSTDVLLGGFRVGSFNRDWDWNTQVLAQVPITPRSEYRMGNIYSANAGLRYRAFDHVTPNLQVNGVYRRADTGMNSDASATGGRFVYLNPGLTMPLSKSISTYASFQLPLYQHVTGLQLTPYWTASVGVNYRFQ